MIIASLQCLADLQGLTSAEMKWLATGLVVTGFLLGLAVLIKVLRDKGKISTTLEGQPITIREEIQFVPVPEFEKFEQYVRKRNHDLDGELAAIKLTAELRRQEATDQSAELLAQIQAKLESNWKELNKDRSASIAQLHIRLEATNEKMRGETDEKLQIVRSEINEMPGKIIALLRDTGALDKGGRK